MEPQSSPLKGRPIVSGFFDKRTFSVQYIVADLETRDCAIVDPVLDLDEKSGSIATWSADCLLEHIRHEAFALKWILDTHPHADHLSAAGYLKTKQAFPQQSARKLLRSKSFGRTITITTTNSRRTAHSGIVSSPMEIDSILAPAK